MCSSLLCSGLVAYKDTCVTELQTSLTVAMYIRMYGGRQWLNHIGRRNRCSPTSSVRCMNKVCFFIIHESELVQQYQ